MALPAIRVPALSNSAHAGSPSIAARVAASVVWLTAGGVAAVRGSAPASVLISDLSAVLAALAVTLLGFTAALVSGFFAGTGAFDVTTTCFTG